MSKKKVSGPKAARVAAAVMRAAAVVALAGLAPAQVLKRTFTGSDGEHASVVANVGDVNADTYPDVAIGAPDASGGGRVDVYSGLDGSLLHTIRPADLTGSWITYHRIGTAIAGNLDCDGDGWGDLLLGDPRNRYSDGGGYWEVGYGVIYSVHTGTVLKHLSDGYHDEEFGFSVATLPDYDGDGLPEVAIGNPGAERVYVISSGGPGWYDIIDGSQPGSRFGHSLATMASDLDGDGLDDLAIGAPLFDDKIYNNAGLVSIYSSVDRSHLADLANTDAPTAQFGYSLASLGDADGDGFDDFAIGSPEYDDPITGFANAGRVQVFSNFNLLPGTLVGGAGDSLVGTTVANVGNQNLDGIDDLAIGDMNPDPAYYGGNGTAVTISGADNGSGHYTTVLHVHAVSMGSGGTDRRYAATIVGGDFDRDGYSEMLVGDHDWHVETGNGLVDWWEAAPARFTGYGNGWPGLLRTPTINVNIPPYLGATIYITISSSADADTLGLIWLGSKEAKVPLHSGAVLLVDPWFVLLTNVPKAGLTFSEDIPMDDALAGTSFFLQACELDKAAVGGLAWTAGLELGIGFKY